ncbi:aspartyl protease family protein [Blastomonas sp. AAP53]|uniref:aspartyl protease family protein n=1 Tax=Blastomonas sp. AAP53 TaxID=1248760 RepID=UPI0002DA6852|nr:aspartyl protease family protein [Blastomonas sp. AAP53]
MLFRPLAGAFTLMAALAVAPSASAQEAVLYPKTTLGEITAADGPGLDAETITIDRDRANRMTVPVGIDGRGPFSFMIDTGSERTVVSRDIASVLSLELAEIARLVSIAGTKMVQTVYLPEVTLGRRNYGELVAPILEPQHIGADGILGLDGLQDQRILFDFLENAITVEDVTERVRTSDFEIVVSARRRSGQLIFTDATIGGKRVSVVIDTGAESNIGNLALLKRLGTSSAINTQQASLTSVTGQTILADAGLASDFRLGRAQFDYVPVVFADAEAFRELGLDKTPALLLGMSTLRLFNRMMIDFKQRRVLFDMPSDAPRKPGRARI